MAQGKEEKPAAWHQLSPGEAAGRLGCDEVSGLDPARVTELRETHGRNEIIEKDSRSLWTILGEQLREPMVFLLIGAAGVSIGVGETIDAVAILVIVVLNTILGFVQDFRAERAMAKLKEMTVPNVEVRRQGQIRTISARELVPGDIILVAAGDRVAADCRILESRSLEVQEAALTGESQPVPKHTEAIEDPDLALGDRRNMLYMGTDITTGRGEALVAETGMRTELGRIADMIQTADKRRTPLQRRLARLGIRLSIAALAIVGVVFIIGVAQGKDLNLMLMTALSMAVAAVPEGLPAVATISLALGAKRLLRRNALIRKLPAVETLGSVTVICSDKTGTLTANRMQVTSLWDGDGIVELHQIFGDDEEFPRPDDPRLSILEERPALPILLLTEDLCNDAWLDLHGSTEAGETSSRQLLLTRGDPTEGALVAAAARFGFDKAALEESLPRIGELPFESERKRMTTIHDTSRMGELSGPAAAALASISNGTETSRLALMKGALDAVLDGCGQVFSGGNLEPLTQEHRNRIVATDSHLAGEGKRVLGLAFRWLPEDLAIEPPDPALLETEFVFLGLAAMIDPPRSEAARAVARCRSAGIRPIMITGDHPRTAQFIAKQIGIANEHEPVTGKALAESSAGELEDIVTRTNVYARVAPEHKLRIVEALQNNGQIVAMTGDGVNDAPALKKADIGVAMGITGTDVSKEAAETVLLDDDFATIVNSVEEGRTIYDNICKFLKYTLTSNLGEILVMVAAPFLGMPLPLIPLQILWINLVTDGLPGLALSVEPAEKNIMRRPPRPPAEAILNREMIRDIFLFGSLMGAVSLGAGYFYWPGNETADDDRTWGTIIFTVLTLSQMGNALAVRSSRDSLFRIGLFSNKALLGAVALTFLLQLAVIYVPFLQEIFRTTPLSFTDLLICLAASTLVFWVVEVQKLVLRSRRTKSDGQSQGSASPSR